MENIIKNSDTHAKQANSLGTEKISINFTDLPTIEGNQITGYNTDKSEFTTDFTDRSVRFIRQNKEKPCLL